MVGLVRTNGFVVTDLDGRRLGNALFPRASFFNHSCEPNVVVGFTAGECKSGGGDKSAGLRLEARAVRPVAKGEELCIDYLWRAATRPRQLFFV